MVHSFYSSQQPSGENNVVLAEREALQAQGHEVELVSISTDDVVSERAYAARAALRVATGFGRNPLGELADLHPDIVHVHNLFPNFSRRWVTDLEVPLVHTVHNYRPVCANGTLLRDGKICTLCPDGARWAGVRHACYRDSRAATLPLAWANRRGPSVDPLLARADRLIVLSGRQRDLLASAGIAADRMVIWPNFVPARLDPGPAASTVPPDGWVFVGRLSEEKGIAELIDRWPRDVPLRIIGDGPERGRIEAAAPPSVELLGARGRTEIIQAMRTSVGLIFPSLWLESSATPLVYVEALAAGLPVAAFPPSPVTESVRSDGTGTVFDWRDDLGPALAAATHTFTGLRKHCREVFERTYTVGVYSQRATSLYEDVLEARTRGTR